LNECVERADKVVKETDLLENWPTTPGTTFLWMGGDSAVEAALEFSRAVLSATLWTRVQTVGVLGHNPPDLRIAEPHPDPKITAWRDATVKELQDHTLPPAPAWPMWEILRDVRKMGSLLRDEYSRALKARTEPARGREVEPAYLDALAIMSRVSPAEVNDVEMPLLVPEVEVRRTFERLLGERYHAKDSSVESCDMFTLQGTHEGRHCRVAAMFKGPGNKKWPLQIAGCGKNGNQVVKLFGVPADVYIVQANGAFDPHLLKHVQHTADAHAMRDGHVVPYILNDGTTTARILRAAQETTEEEEKTI
jgi:hypothetical protein